jgi:DNA-binding response OmpR family regulator
MTGSLDGLAREEIPPIVLVVENDRDTREMYEALLNSEGFWVLKVSDASEAFEYARDFRPDAVVTDLGLAGESDGAELIRRLRGSREFDFMPVIAVTGLQPPEMPSLNGLEVAAVLLKPVSPRTLVDRLEAALQKSAVLRARSRALLERIPVLLKRSLSASRRSSFCRASTPPTLSRQRNCPSCGQPLLWIDTSMLVDGTFDFYDACARGCGAFSFNRSTGRFDATGTRRRSTLHRNGVRRHPDD